MDALAWHRFQFGFTVTYHYLFPQLTMGLALLLVIFKAIGLKTGNKTYNEVAKFWGKIFAINFAVGVVTGTPLEFEFGTNWARFSNYAGGVIGVTLAMEGMFAFFAESAFLGLFLFGEKKLSPLMHFLSSLMIFVGSWLSGYFIIVTNSFMQHPVGFKIASNGILELANLWEYLLNPWVFWQYCHNMSAAVVTGSFVVAAVGAFWALMRKHMDHAKACLQVGIITGLIFSVLQIFPTGDMQGKLVATHQKPTLAAMEGKFVSGSHAELAIIGQPDVEQKKLTNPVYVPEILSYLCYGSFGAQVEGLNDFKPEDIPDNIELIYYAYHVMVGLGTYFIAIMTIATFFVWKRTIARQRWLLWMLMLSFPFPYIATTAGWMVAELGRQPWVVYGLLRTAQGTSPLVHAGNVAFSALGFMGLYMVVGILFLYLVWRELCRGPELSKHPEAVAV